MKDTEPRLGFKWYHEVEIPNTICGTREEMGFTLLAKVPMEQIVIDTDRFLYTYGVVDGKIRYIRLGTATIEEPKQVKGGFEYTIKL
jgi:hypothetical protein